MSAILCKGCFYMNENHQFIKDNYSKMTCKEIADIIGYKEESVRTIASKMGVNKYYETLDLPEEEWRTHSDYPSYLISNKGRVKSKLRNKLIFTRVHYGYKECRVKDKTGKNKSQKIHRLVAQVFITNPENKPYVNHIDGDKLNNNVENLEWVTAKENVAHAIESGLAKYRTDTLTEKEVHGICKMISEGRSQREIMSVSQRFTTSRVQKIRQRRRWTRISKDYEW